MRKDISKKRGEERKYREDCVHGVPYYGIVIVRMRGLCTWRNILWYCYCEEESTTITYKIIGTIDKYEQNKYCVKCTV